MGLPIWRAPSLAENRAQAIKNDASASARSPIRRSSPTARPGRSSARNDANPHTRRTISLAELAARRSYRAVDEEAERDQDGRSEERRNPGLNGLTDDLLSDLDRLAAVSAEIREQAHSPEERVHLYISTTDGTSIRASRFGPNHPESPFSRARSAVPERESSSGPDRARAQDSLERSRHAPRSVDLLSRMPASRRRRVWSNRAQEPLGELPRHTYRRAPTHWPFAYEPAEADDDSTPAESNRELADATRDLPPLRRMGRRQVTDGFLPSSSLRQSWSPSGNIDGLGDRERSLSPPTDPWETMLTTITPDTQLPSADSSFTAASASFSASNNSQDGSDSSRAESTSSPSTQITVPSRRQSPDESASLLPQRACDTDDDMSGNDTEGEERSEMNRARANARRYRTYTSGYRQPQDAPPSRDPDAYHSSVRSRSRDATNFVRNYFAFAERGSSSARSSPAATSRSPPPSQIRIEILPRVPRLHRENSSGAERSVENRRDSAVGSDSPSLGHMDPELESMRDILAELARRNDVPQDFWISAGLTPPMLESIQRGEPRERGHL
ncbi:hypothetical protein MPH_01122 [Macrophomina phaseolina MS6]|uniref:Uncharacterized protein n=1 Tax=Macrophomina phaseolina (strain MS6) TaxID=1126212 RepID=K2S3N6_MACPH|nr:hypothetical protein MPH_01122 [Macrophomina phaseolina MS6]